MNRLLVGWAIVWGVLLVGCETVTELKPSQLPPDTRNEKIESRMEIESLSIEKTTQTCVRVVAKGVEERQWEERQVQQKRREVSTRSYDAPTFQRITKVVPPFSWTMGFLKSKWGFGLTKVVGFFPVTKWTDWNKVLYVTKKVGIFPLGTLLAKADSHVLKEISGGDGLVDCPVFPCTLSDEELYAFGYTILYPFAVLGAKPGEEAKALLAPLAVGLNPTIDVTAYALDVTTMSLIGSFELTYAILAPTVDVSAMATTVSVDAGVAATVAGCDVGFTTLAVIGDGLMWMGDAVYPGGVSSRIETGEREPYGEWTKKSDASKAPDWGTYSVQFECGQNSVKAPLDASGLVVVPVKSIRPGNWRTKPLQEVKATLVDKDGKAVGAPTTAKVNFDEL